MDEVANNHPCFERLRRTCPGPNCARKVGHGGVEEAAYPPNLARAIAAVCCHPADEPGSSPPVPVPAGAQFPWHICS